MRVEIDQVGKQEVRQPAPLQQLGMDIAALRGLHDRQHIDIEACACRSTLRCARNGSIESEVIENRARAM